MTLLHKNQTETEGIHQLFNWVWADESEIASEVVDTNDIYKVGFAVAEETAWVLTDPSTPVWIQLNVAVNEDTDLVVASIQIPITNGNGRTRVMRETSSGTTPITLKTAGGTSLIVLTSKETMAFEVIISYRENAATPYSGMFIRRGLIDINTTPGTCALVGSVDATYTNQDGTASVSLTADTSGGGLVITVTGVAGKTLLWTAVVNSVSSIAD